MAVFSAMFALALHASAQPVYPPPTPTDTPLATPTPTPTKTPKPGKTPKPKKCATTGTSKKNSKFTSTNEFKRGQRIIIKGEAKCANVGVRVGAQFDDQGSKTPIGQTTSSQKGGYTIQGNIPPSASFGDHTVIVKTSGKKYTAKVSVVPATGSRRSNAVAGSLLAAWVALAGIAGAFFAGSRRRRRPYEAKLAVATESDVPMLDTSSFVPSYHRRHGTGARRAPAKTAPKKAAPKKKPSVAKSTKSTRTKPVARKPKSESEPKPKSESDSTDEPTK